MSGSGSVGARRGIRQRAGAMGAASRPQPRHSAGKGRKAVSTGASRVWVCAFFSSRNNSTFIAYSYIKTGLLVKDSIFVYFTAVFLLFIIFPLLCFFLLWFVPSRSLSNLFCRLSCFFFLPITRLDSDSVGHYIYMYTYLKRRL